MAAGLSFPVLWHEGDGAPVPGRLDVRESSLLFDGGTREARRIRELPLAEIADVHIGRTPRERVAGRPALVLELTAGGVVAFAGLERPGMLHELASWIRAAIGLS